jgi:hypothetical protein
VRSTLGFQHLTNAARLLLIAAQAEAHHRAEGFVGTDHVLLAAVNRTSHGCPELYALTGELERLSITTMSIDALARTRRQSGETRIETNHALGPLTCRIRGRILHDPARVVTLRQTREYRAALQSLWSRESATDAVDVFAAMLVPPGAEMRRVLGDLGVSAEEMPALLKRKTAS